VERWWALGGLFLSIIAFVGYLFLMVQQADEEHNPDLRNRIDSAIIKVPFPSSCEPCARLPPDATLVLSCAGVAVRCTRGLAPPPPPTQLRLGSDPAPPRAPPPLTSRLIAGRAPACPANPGDWQYGAPSPAAHASRSPSPPWPCRSDTPITLSGVLYPMIADGQAKMKEQRISKGLKQYSATLLDKDKKRLAKILEPFFHKARTPTPFTSRLIAGRAPARPTNRRLAV
jgi:hypothetical protein